MKKKFVSLVLAVMFVGSLLGNTPVPNIPEKPEEKVIIEQVRPVPKVHPTPVNPAVYDIPAKEPVVIPEAPSEDIDILAKTVFGEGRGVSPREQVAIVECIFNRVESSEFPNTIREVITQTKPCVQFVGYSSSHPVTDEIREVCVETWQQWYCEKNGLETERVLPKKYLYFHAEKSHNVFTTRWDHWNDSDRFTF